jgi:uncharacterized repeat protein (TIGR01451 family)
VKWGLGQLGAYERRVIEVTYRADKQGSVRACVDVTAAGGLKASTCATTTVGAVGTVPPSILVITPGGGVVTVSISRPREVKVGDEVTFTIQLINRGATPATNLKIRDEYDAGLTHAQGPGPMTFAFGDLAARAASPVYSITFRAAKAGMLTHRVTVTGTGGIVAEAEGWVMAVGPGGAVEPGPTPAESTKGLSATIRVDGPKELAVNGLAKFTATIANTTTKEMRSVRVVVQHDASLDAKSATGGNAPQGNSLVWVLESVQPGQPVALEVHCLCVTAAEKACCRVTATTIDGASGRDEVCVKIRAGGVGPGGGEGVLSMTLADLRDPVNLNKEVTYEIQVHNQGSAAERLVALTVTLPEGMIPVRLGTTGPPGTQYNIQGQRIVFDSVEKLGPGEPLNYRVRVLAKKLGLARVRAELMSVDHPQPQVKEETTSVQ